MNSNLSTVQTRKLQMRRIIAVALLMMIIASTMSLLGVDTFLAVEGHGGGGGNAALGGVVGIVIKIVKQAALYIGLIIAIWGVFQIVLAFRREDSEGISKQITTVVVGSVLVGFGAFIDDIVTALGVNIGG